MKIRWRRVSGHDTDPERVFGVFFLSLFAAFLWLVAKMPVHLVPGCLLREWTGIPCLACGSLRALKHLTAGEPGHALRVQPLATVLVVLGLAYLLYAWIVVLFRLPRIRLEKATKGERLALVVIALLAAAANWGYLFVVGR